MDVVLALDHFESVSSDKYAKLAVLLKPTDGKEHRLAQCLVIEWVLQRQQKQSTRADGALAKRTKNELK